MRSSSVVSRRRRHYIFPSSVSNKPVLEAAKGKTYILGDIGRCSIGSRSSFSLVSLSAWWLCVVFGLEGSCCSRSQHPWAVRFGDARIGLSTKRSPSVLDQFKSDPPELGNGRSDDDVQTTIDDKVYSEPGKKRHNESQPRARLLTSSATQRPLESRAYSTTHHHKSRSPTFVSKISTTQKRKNAKKSRGQRKETGFELAHQTDSC